MKVFAILLALLFPSCAFAGAMYFYGPVYAYYRMSPAKGGGCISGSIGDAITGNYQGKVFFISEENAGKVRRSAHFGYVDGNAKTDFLPGIATFTMCLKPGRYRLFAISTSHLVSTLHVNIPFEVVAGQNIYLGSFMFYGYAPNPDCNATPAKMFVGVRDEFERDAPHLEAGRDAPGLPLQRGAIDPVDGFPYFVACKPA